MEEEDEVGRSLVVLVGVATWPYFRSRAWWVSMTFWRATLRFWRTASVPSKRCEEDGLLDRWLLLRRRPKV